MQTTVPTDCNLNEGYRIDDRFVIERWIGGGGFGCAYLAQDQKNFNRQVVIKTLRVGVLDDETLRKKFRQEGEALSRIHHGGVVTVFDTGQLPDGNPFLVMEYFEGGLLRKLIPSKGMDFEVAADLIRQIASALRAAHDKSVYHRDLKPENIMVQLRADGTRVAKLIDFGIAKVVDSLVTRDTKTAKYWGTPRYMSPEQLSGKPVENPASDIYALGVTTYEMITGRYPFATNHGDNNAGEELFLGELIERQKKKDLEAPRKLRPDLPADAEGIILKALEYDPNKRYQDAADFGRELALALTNREGLARKSNSRMAAILALTAIVVLAVLGAWLVSSKWDGSVADRNPTVVNTASNAEPLTESNAHTLTYYLTVQKMRDGQPYQQPFRSSGQEIFESGYKFKFNLLSADAGHLYLFNEGAAGDGKTYFNILYPTPKRNEGSSLIKANQQIATADNDFGGKPDTEKFWIIWTKEELPELEAARTAAFSGSGKIKDPSEDQRLRAFLQEKSTYKPEVQKDVNGKQTVIMAKGDVVVSLLYLEHR
jgi:serine/threonine protein kinase